MLDEAYAGGLQVTLLALAELLAGYFLVTELDCLVSFLLLGHLLHDHAGAGLDDGHGNDQICVMPTFLPMMAFFIVFPPNGYWLPRMVRALGARPEAGNLTRLHSQAAGNGLRTVGFCSASLF